ncbi:hypothetical protein C8J57DRAFT_1220149 [Mycena rebaudengoi]|nr:hypothetical protein C8J57DRAFT_1220149 [Mycena rebaudengoi]
MAAPHRPREKAREVALGVRGWVDRGSAEVGSAAQTRSTPGLNAVILLDFTWALFRAFRQLPSPRRITRPVLFRNIRPRKYLSVQGNTMNTLQSGDGDIWVMNTKASEHLEVTVTWHEPLVDIVMEFSIGHCFLVGIHWAIDRLRTAQEEGRVGKGRVPLSGGREEHQGRERRGMTGWKERKDGGIRSEGSGKMGEARRKWRPQQDKAAAENAASSDVLGLV